MDLLWIYQRGNALGAKKLRDSFLNGTTCHVAQSFALPVTVQSAVRFVDWFRVTIILSATFSCLKVLRRSLNSTAATHLVVGDWSLSWGLARVSFAGGYQVWLLIFLRLSNHSLPITGRSQALVNVASR